MLHAIDHPGDMSLVGPGDPQPNLIMHAGKLMTQDPLAVDPVLEGFTIQDDALLSKRNANSELYRLWGKLFSHVGNPDHQIFISIN
jgi:hypothetical protein